MSRRSSASRSSRSRPRSSRATATRCSSPRSASSPPRSSGSRPKSAICSAPKCCEAEEFFSPGPEGLLGDAAQAQPGAVGEPHRPRAHGARLCVPAMENVALWHERDISHSSVERMIGPDATITLDFALARLTGIIDKLAGLSRNMKQEPRDRLGGLPHPSACCWRSRKQGPRAKDGLQAGAEKRDEGLAWRRRLRPAVESRQGSDSRACPIRRSNRSST